MRIIACLIGLKYMDGISHWSGLHYTIGILIAICASGAASGSWEIQITGWGLDGVPYELWGSQEACPWNEGTGYYDAPNYGYDFIGSATAPQTFTVEEDYRYYVVGTKGEMQLDAIRTAKEQYLDSEHYGPLVWVMNSHVPYEYDEYGNVIGSLMDYANWDYLWGAPDGQTNNLGFPIGGGYTSGVLHGGVVFEKRDVLGALCIGSNDDDGMNGQTDANNVCKAMSKLGDWEGGEIMDFHYNEADPNAKQEIFNVLLDGEKNLQKDDVVVFFYSGHASGGVGPEAMAYTASEDQWISDEELASWFDGTGGVGTGRLDWDVWDNVNKLFIMDCCHAEGFWGPGDDGKDLALLPKVAILAACSEIGTTGYDGDTGEGYLAKAVAAAFDLVDHNDGQFTAADKDFDGLSFEELKVFVNEFGDQYFPADGSILVNLKDDGVAPFEWSVVGWSSQDFRMSVIGQASVASSSNVSAQYGGGSGTADNPYQISTAADLIALGEEPNDYDKHFILTADIDLDPNLPGRKVFDRAVIAPDLDDTTENFVGTPFTGKLDGDNHKLLNLEVNTDGLDRNYLGLFGQIDSNAIISNLGLEYVVIAGSGNRVHYPEVEFTGNFGGLCGVNSGLIQNCWVNGSVTGGDYSEDIGGLCGWNKTTAIVTSCYVVASVSGGANSGGIGGLCGSNDGLIENCWASGSVSGRNTLGGLCGFLDAGSITDSYSTAVVTGTEYSLGGFVGNNSGGIVGNSYWDMISSGMAESDGGAGKTTAEMKQQATFEGWDFINVWDIGENQTYPYLRTHLAGDLNKDRIVNFLDLCLIAQQWMEQY